LSTETGGRTFLKGWQAVPIIGIIELVENA
jgi:hypothetical protein